jgi:hypothetical protein
VKLTNLADRAVRRLGFDGLHRRRPAKALGLELSRQRWAEDAERERKAKAKVTEAGDGR